MPEYEAVASLGTGQKVPWTEWKKVPDDIQLHQDVQTVQPLNNTGGSVARGYVGVLDDVSINSLIPSAMAGDSRRVVVVQQVSATIGALVYCQIQGRCAVVNVQGAVGLHDPLETHSTPGYARAGTGAPFGISMGIAAGPGAGTVVALLIPLMAGGGFTTGIPSATHGTVSFHNNGITLVTNVIAAPGAGQSIYITSIEVQQNNTTPSLYDFKDSAGPNHIQTYVIAGVQGFGVVHALPSRWKLGDNLALNMQQTALADVYGSIDFYTGAA